MNNYKIILFIALICITQACKKSSETEPVASQETEQPSDVITITKQQFDASGYEIGGLEPSLFAKTIVTTGVIEVPISEQAAIHSQVEGILSPYNIEIGQYVKRGQLLASVTNAQLIDNQEDYIKSVADQKYTASEVERLSSLASENITTKKEMNKLAADLKQTNTHIGALAQKLRLYGINPLTLNEQNMRSKIAITAPINGFIHMISAPPGSFIDTKTDLFLIYNTEHMHASISILPSDVPSIRVGQEVKVESNNGQSFTAKVSKLSRHFDEDKTLKAICEIPTEYASIFLSGDYVKATFLLEKNSTLGLKKEAVVGDQDKGTVLILKSKSADSYTFKPVSVTIKTSNATHYSLSEIKELEGKEILTKGSYYLVQ